MSVEQAGSVGVAAVVQELTRLEQHAAQARKVIVITGDMRPALLSQLRGALAPIGIDCVEIEPRGQQEYFDALPAAERVPIQSFAELLASPELAPLMIDPLADPQSLLYEDAPTTEQERIELLASLERVLAPAPEPAPVAQVESRPSIADTIREVFADCATHAPSTPKPDMTRPANWKPGDIFSESPKLTLPHLRREWFIKEMDAIGAGGDLTGLNIEIERVNANRTELLTIEQFQRTYVFVRHAETAAA